MVLYNLTAQVLGKGASEGGRGGRWGEGVHRNQAKGQKNPRAEEARGRKKTYSREVLTKLYFSVKYPPA